jgi:hypothetical protein
MNESRPLERPAADVLPLPNVSLDGPPVTWSSVLCGLINDAFDLRGTVDYRVALNAIVRAYQVWPLAQALHALREADQLLRAREAEAEAELLAWYESIGVMA